MTNASYTVTLYKLFLGDQDSVTGFFRQGYTIHSIEVAIFPSGGTFNFGSMGYHHVYGAVGFTEYDVVEGDVIFDTFDRYYMIKARKPWTSGDLFRFYELELEELSVFPFLSGFFGFEDVEHGEIGYEFEEGFERGTWAL